MSYDFYDTGEVVRLYRIVRGPQATVDDFLSQQILWERRPPERRRPPPTAPHLQAIWDGISVSAALMQAARQHERNPRLGQYLAILDVPVIRFPVSRSTETQGHFTIWGMPLELLALVFAVIPMPR